MALAARNIDAVPQLWVGQSQPYVFNSNGMKKEQILQHAVQNSMVGILSQLSYLAAYSHDLFSSLTTEVTQVYTRTCKLTTRAEKVGKTIASVESVISNHTLSDFCKNPRVEFAVPVVSDAQLFTSDTAPKTIKAFYEKSTPPPPLHKMDAYMDEGKKCLELYTNPKFFLDEWIAEQIKQRQAAKEERRKRREERKARKQNEPKKAALGAAQPAKLQKVAYDPVTGEKIMLKSDEPSSRASLPPQSTLRASPSNSGHSNNSVKGAGSGFFSSPPPPPPVGGLDDPPPPPPDEFFAPPPPPPPDSVDLPPPPPPREGDAPLPPPVATFNPQIKQTPILVSQAPSPMRVSSSAPRQERKDSAVFSAPPPPPQNLPVAPPPPPPGTFGAEKTPPPSGSLLSELQSKSLKPAAPPPPKTVDARSNLLEGIKMGIALRSANERQVLSAAPTPAQPQSVAEILSRRIAIQGSDSEEEEDGDDGEWG